MPSTVNLPVFGPTNKGTVAGVAIGGTVLAGYMIYRKRKTAAKQAAAVQAASAQAGYGYGGAQYGYGSVYDNGYYGYGASGGFQAGYYAYGTPYTAPTQQAVAATTNGQWTQAAISQLTQDGVDAQTAASALGAYIAGAQVTSAQQTIIQEALAIEGYPPQAGANGYPPSIHVQATTGGGTGGGQTGGGSGGSGNSQGPNPTGQTLSAALASSNIVNVSYAYKDVPQASWGQYGSHTIASATSTGTGWRVGLN